MKKNKWKLVRNIGTTLGVALLLLAVAPYGRAQEKKEGEKTIQILFTHDLHSHLDPFAKLQDGKDISVGGIARIRTLVEEARKKNPELLLVDAGDFSMGTLYQCLYETEAAELRMLGSFHYDAVTFGNHEFDYGATGLAHMLHAAVQSKDELPQILTSNINFPDSIRKKEEGVEELQQALEEVGAKEYQILEREGIRIGIFSSFGQDAIDCSPNAGVEFFQQVERAKEQVEALKKEGVDMILCLSHGGTWEDKDKSEDELLAKAVPEIDVIVSGHTHTVLTEPILVGSTWIVSSGEYGQFLGNLSIVQQEDGTFGLSHYELMPVTAKVPSHGQTTEKLQGFRDQIEREYLSRYGYDSFDQVLTYNPYEFPEVSEVYKIHKEHNLGNIITDSYIYAVKEAEGEEYVPIDLAVVASGVIRASLVKDTDITVSDAFRVSALGQGADGETGYPLVSVYLTGKEIATVAEVDASISNLMDSARLYWSGISVTFNPNRLFLNRVTQVKLVGENGTLEDLEEDKLYRVVTGLYCAQMLGVVEKQSKGLLSLEPKMADGSSVTDFNACIITGEQGEVKEWTALASYLESFPEKKIPQRYQGTEERKIVDDSHDFSDLIRNPSETILKLGAILLGILIVFFGGIVLIVRRIRRRKGRRKE